MISPQSQSNFTLLQRHIAQQPTIPVPAIEQSHTSAIRPIEIQVQIPGQEFTPAKIVRPDMKEEGSTTQTITYAISEIAEKDESAQKMTSEESDQTEETEKAGKKHLRERLIAVAIVLAMSTGLYLVWRPSTSTSAPAVMAPQNFNTTTNGTSGTDGANAAGNVSGNTGVNIQVYIEGAVIHPGVYTLASSARIYELVQAAGGALPDANMGSINLAARLNDGQEVYVARVGETPSVSPGQSTGATTSAAASGTNGISNVGSNQGQVVNINSASGSEMQQKLHISSKTAQEIVNYRQQHGVFTSVDELQQAISKTIYKKIENMVTV